LKHSPESQCELQSQHSLLLVALPARVMAQLRALVARQALVQVARLALAQVRVAQQVRALVQALAEHLPHLLLRQLQ